MPGSKSKMKGKAGRAFRATVDLSSKSGAGVQEVKSLGDGTSAYRVAAGPGANVPFPAIEHGGAHVVVLSGDLTLDGVSYPERSCIWIGAGDTVPPVAAGANGVVAAFLSYPTKWAGISPALVDDPALTL
jgi:hypothetical protein